MIPHERSLVKRLQDKPFALIGVNADRDKEVYVREAKRMGVTWRSFWSDPSRGGKTIASQWRINTWPTSFAIDAKGIIRHRWIGVPNSAEVDQALDELIASAARDG